MRKYIWLTFMTLLTGAALFFMGLAQVQAKGVARGYITDDQALRPGMTVALSPSGTADRPKVERATRETANKIIGVTTGSDETTLTIASGEQQAYVQTEGEVIAYVSDINGMPKKGDKLTISPFKGILMLSDSRTPVLGSILEDFSVNKADEQNVITDSGQKTMKVAKLTISLDSNLRYGQEGDDSVLKRLGRAITGKEVGEVQVAVALIIFLIVMITEGAIIYGAISSSITALGRNPLARKIIKAELVRVLLLAILVLFIGLAAIFAVLSI